MFIIGCGQQQSYRANLHEQIGIWKIWAEGQVWNMVEQSWDCFTALNVRPGPGSLPASVNQVVSWEDGKTVTLSCLQFHICAISCSQHATYGANRT